MSNYHFVSEKDVRTYVLKLSKFFPSSYHFAQDVEESINVFKSLGYEYIEEIRFYERVLKYIQY